MSDMHPVVTIEDLSQVKKKINITVPWTNVQDELSHVYREASKTIKVKGFRQGKVPRQILERQYRGEIEAEAVNNLMNRYYWEALEAKGILAVTKPQIEQGGLEEEKDFHFSAVVEVEPEIDPKDYLGLPLEKDDPAVTDADVETKLQEIRQMYATMEELQEDRGIQNGDFAMIDFEGSLAGEARKELKSDNYYLEVGSGTFVPGFEEKLIGLKTGDMQTIQVTFPKDYHAQELADKEVVFSVTVKGIRTKKLPELDESFVKNFERYETLDALVEDVRLRLASEKMAQAKESVRASIADGLLERNSFDVPNAYVERQIFYMMSETQRRMIASGMDAKRAAEFTLKLRDQFRTEAEKAVKTILLLKRIARKEGLAVSDEETEARIKEMASQRSQDYEPFRKSLEKDDLIENVTSELLTEKTYAYLEDHGHVTLVARKSGEAER